MVVLILKCIRIAGVVDSPRDKFFILSRGIKFLVCVQIKNLDRIADEFLFMASLWTSKLICWSRLSLDLTTLPMDMIACLSMDSANQSEILSPLALTFTTAPFTMFPNSLNASPEK